MPTERTLDGHAAIVAEVAGQPSAGIIGHPAQPLFHGLLFLLRPAQGFEFFLAELGHFFPGLLLCLFGGALQLFAAVGVVDQHASLEAEVGEERANVGAGDLAVIPAMVPHGLVNVGEDTLRVVGFFCESEITSTLADVPNSARVRT